MIRTFNIGSFYSIRLSINSKATSNNNSNYTAVVSQSQRKTHHQSPPHATLTKPLYENCSILSPDGTLMARVGKKKLEWYLNRNLAKTVDENTIQLTFQPHGPGNAGDNFYLSDKENECVCCGTEEHLTKHHIIPHEYRKWLDENIKSHSSHDIVLLCSFCHDNYECEALHLRKKIANEFNAPLQGTGKYRDTELNKIKKLASALLLYRSKMPMERIYECERKIKDYLKQNLNNDISCGVFEEETLSTFQEQPNLSISEETLQQIAQMNDLIIEPNAKSHGEMVIEALQQTPNPARSIADFALMWRQHFIEVLKPNNLNQFWKVEKPLLRE
eukprot:gb/GECH01008101.1/.p1 GENE.gb/GECH01008101.1/~~gb/GECH01008101.1/.p1  ORF type:complete len:331 (+),score=80.79 gb/GECH01008101.1/:1-993(+)